MSGDKITGFNPEYKGDNDFTRELTLMALSDAKHDFNGKETYNESIEKVLKKGLPHTFTGADAALKAVEEEKVIEYIYGISQDSFFKMIRDSKDSFIKINTKLGKTPIHTHNAKALQIYDDNDKFITAFTGKRLVDLLDINNANLVVDLDAISFMAALKTGPVTDKTVNYLLVSESFNDPASRQGPTNEIFSMKEGIKLQSLMQYGGLPYKYNAWNTGQQNHTNDFFSKYNFELSPILEPKKGKFNTTMTITNPEAGSKKVFIDNPKKDNSITAIKNKIKEIMAKFLGRGGAAEKEGIFQQNVKYQQKRSGDWLQALSVQDVLSRNFINFLTGKPVNISGDNYLVTHDRIALTYALLTGSNAIFVHYWKGKGRFVYIFKKVKPVPVITGTSEPQTQVNPEDILLNYYKGEEGKAKVKEVYKKLIIKYNEVNKELERYKNEIESISDSLVTVVVPTLDKIKELLKILAIYIYICSNLPHYTDIAKSLHNNYNTIKDYINSDSEDRKENINRLNSLFNKILSIIDIKINDLIDKVEFTQTEEYKSIAQINFTTDLDNYKGLHYITNNSMNAYNIYNLRNLVAATFEKLLRLPYFDHIDKTNDDILIQRLLILGLTELSTDKPDPKIIQTFNQRVKEDELLNEAAAFKIEEETADILMNFSRGYDYLVSFHLHNDPIFRESLETENEVAKAFYGGITGGGTVQTLQKQAKTHQKQGRTRHKHGKYTRLGSRKLTRGESMRITQGVTAYATRDSVFKFGSTVTFKPFSGVGNTRMAYSAEAIESAVNTVNYYGHHPFTPLLYLQYKILPYILENDKESPDYIIYLMLGKIINVLIYRLNELMKMGNDSDTVLGGIILKYLLFVAIPKQKHLGVLFYSPSKVGYMEKQLSILLGLLTESVDLHYNERQEAAFARLFERPDIALFINTIRGELSRLTVNRARSKIFISKTIKNMIHMYSSITNIGEIVATRKRTVFAPPPVIGTKRRRPISEPNTSNSNNMGSPSKRTVSSPKTKRAKRSHNTNRTMIAVRPTIRIPSNSSNNL